ncbi:DNA helicase IV [Streptomyces zhaozhouensis]|uniref:DNA helicase IV n=1 Tax=Streptomyces zhaozhouensis TaxID=1300267 RepID=A0A286DQ58_9ACTN|nr:AAA family ATPase [Streptomyces zhaozhouensis]SOD60817.1 DNA helicase IV [Streptomyces zhaozhouensis]
MSSDAESPEIAAEQAYVDGLYLRLDTLRNETAERLDATLASTGLTHQGLAERDLRASELAAGLARLDAVESGLCFGRLDLADDEGTGSSGTATEESAATDKTGAAGAHGTAHPASGETRAESVPVRERRYVGRLGLRADDGEFTPLLIDWRAPAARPFYVATALHPDRVRRRRHIRSRGRRVTGVWDEDFSGGASEVNGDAALLEALTAARTDRMSDIVPTIQAEQDEVIRAHHAGVLVVQGGPGTGKTAVALHRAAYLLYTRRERLARSAVLVVGPNPTFLSYIGDVLPSLGETGVLLATVDRLFPGVTARRTESPAGAVTKGRLAMVEVLASAVADRGRPPGEDRVLLVDRQPLTVPAALSARIAARVRESGLRHNEAAPFFRKLLLDALAERVAARYGRDVFDDAPLLTEADLVEIRAELAEDADVTALADELWPTLTPTALLAGLYASEERLAAAAPELSAAERAALHRPEAPAGWTASDVPLLDEAAELLGPVPPGAPDPAEAERAEAVRLAREALEVAYGSREAQSENADEAEELAAWDVVDAEALAERQAETDTRSAARRAATDRTWAFGHVVVDEAQELSPMAWRLLMRRCPTRSMTLVGDIAQTGEAVGAPSWDAVLAPHVGERWRLAELSVNYRLPAEIAEVAAGVLARIDPARRAPRAVRSGGERPWWRRTGDATPAGLAARGAALAAAEHAALPEGRVALLVPRSLLPVTRRAVAALAGAGEVAVLDPGTAKGLEFDVVLVVDPERMVAESPRGLNDLYVALTRSTRRLGLLHPVPPGAPATAPAGLTGLTEVRDGE